MHQSAKLGASKLALAVVLAASVAPAARAQDADTQSGSTRAAAAAAETIVVTGTRTVDRPALSTPFAVSTIPLDEIRAIPPGATDTVQTLLNREPSIIAYTDGPLGTRTNVSFRSFNSGQFAETYDGIALNDAFNAGVTNQASNINNVLLLPSDLDGVEVSRGVNNPAVNSYNSLGGTINYVSRLPTRDASLEVGGSYGSFDTSEEHFSLNTGTMHGVDSFLEVTHQHSNGWNPNTPDTNTHAYYSGVVGATAPTTLNIVLVGNRNVGTTPFNMPVALLNANGGFYQWPRNYTYENDADTNFLGIASLTSRFADNIVLEQKLFGGVNDYKRTSFSNPAFQQGQTLPDGTIQPYNLENTPSGYPFWLNNPGYPNGPTYDPTAGFGSPQAGTDYHFYGYRAWTVGYSPKLTVSIPHNVITTGGNLTFSWLHSREYWYGSYNMPMTPGYNDAWDEHDQRLTASAYIQDEISLLNDTLKITPGVKYVVAETRDTDGVGFYYPLAGAVNDSTDFVSPTIGVSYKPVDHVAVFAAFGQNIKFPDISAFYGAFQTNQATGQNVIVPVRINPEHVNDYELGLRLDYKTLFGTLNVYREDFTNTFVSQFDPATQLSTTVNGGSSRYQGVELALTQDFGMQPWGNLRLNVSFAYNEAKFTSSFNSDYAGQVLAGTKLANVPDYLLSTAAVYAKDGWRVELQGRSVGRQFIDQQNAGTPTQATLRPYYLIDLNIAKVIPINGSFVKTVKLGFDAKNLTNNYYYNEAYTDTDVNNNSFIRAVPAAPRSFLGSVSVGF